MFGNESGETAKMKVIEVDNRSTPACTRVAVSRQEFRYQRSGD